MKPSRHRPTDRRRFLLASAAAGIAASLPACRRRTPIEGAIVDRDLTVGHRIRAGESVPRETDRERHPVVIAGGGVAGLSAAWRLRRAGFHDYLLLELSDAPGGTARGGASGPFSYPWGAHYLPVPLVRQRALVAFLTDAGLVDGADDDGRCRAAMRHLVRAPQERVCQWGFWREGLWPGDGASADDRAQLDRFQARLRELQIDDGELRAFDLPADRSSLLARHLDTIDAATWADQNGLVGERIRWYLEYATRDDYGATLEQTSAWALLHYFCARVSPHSGRAGDYMTWPQGNQFLVDRLLADGRDKVRRDSLVVAVATGSPSPSLTVMSPVTGRAYGIDADQAILAMPQFVAKRVLRDDPHAAARAGFRYGSWVVANVHLRDLPQSRGFGVCWDNVIYGSDSLGYVDATHQLDRLGRDRVLADLRRGHPDIESKVTRIDVWRWGHAMVKPYPGFLFGGDRERAGTPFGGVHFAHSDLGGLPLFEEAFHTGVRAAEEVLAARGVEFESLL